MSTIRNPVGPQPPAVYWRRRLIFGAFLLAVVVIIVLIVSSLSSGTPSGDKTPAPGASDTPSGEPAASPSFTSASNACDPASITVVAVLDATEYAAGVQPQMSMKITNGGSTPCTLDVGTAEQEYLITSGDDRIWSSKDCQTDGAALPVPFEAGETKTTSPAIAWDRTRSATDTCNTTRPAAIANADGPTYRLQVKLGDLESEQASFRLFG